MSSSPVNTSGFAGKLAQGFVNSKLTPLGIIASLLLGFLAVVLLPREEEPQIKVPMIDVIVITSYSIHYTKLYESPEP